MKNLELWDISLLNLKVDTEEKFCMCTGHDEDNNIKSIYICTNELMVRSFDANTGKIRWTTNVSDVATPANKPLNVTCLALQNFLCIGYENGELFTVKDAGKKHNLVGVFDTGMCAMEWSPDNELLSLVTKDMKTCLMSCAFDPVSDTNLWEQDFGNKQFITVGWGKKETQFHGTAGKKAAKLKDEFDLYPVSDKRVKIAWRGDGVLYAIGFSMDGIRRFKVFNREGSLIYTSEKQPALESNISWRPSGNLIATTQKFPDKYTLTFFEKNGLKHGEFTININSQTQVEDVFWSTDSEILTLQCKDSVTNTHTLLLYTMGNYHWYLKQTLNFNSDQQINKVIWDSDFEVICNKIMHVCLQNGQRYSYSWTWNTNHSLGTTVNDDAVVVVIDEKKLLITGFRHAVVPPPMAAQEITLDNNVISVHFAPKHAEQEIDSNTFFTVTSNNKLVFYEQTQKSPLQYKEQKVIQFEKYDFPFQYYNWCWIKSNIIVCVTVDKDCCYILHEYTIDGDSMTKTYFAHIHDSITKIQPHPNDPNILILLLKSCEFMQYKLARGLEPLELTMKNSCPTFSVVAVNDKLRFISITHKGALYLDDVYTMPNVSSFFIHTHFLLITTLQHVLLCVELTEPGFSAVKEYEKESEYLYKRKIERGARIVVVVPSGTRTVFQMPRGNLEVIQPRPLSLKIIGKHLDSLQYHEAFDLMRKQRINLNLIYDHDPEKFIKNIDVFLESVKNNSWLNLFLSDLENSDVTKTMYSKCYVGKTDNTKRENNAKIENVCNMVREQINKRSDSDTKILPLITIFVKKNTVEELEKALSIIKELKIQESEGTKLPVGPDEALKYLLYMVDVNQLYDVALGMYDFDLVLLVANKSQKDPKEFIPMLNDLNAMEENNKRYTINKHLKRFDRAVNCLVMCGSSRHDELRTFVKYHSLYKEALVKFKSDEEIFKQISEDFGLHLKLKKNYIQAGLVYEKAKSFEKAVECYKDALEWQMALKLGRLWPKEQFQALCWDLATALKEEKRHTEAFLILEQFYDDFEVTISYAIECRHYLTALRLCEQHNKHNYKDEKILPALLEETKIIQDFITKSGSTFIKYKERLLTLRQINKKTLNSAESDIITKGNHLKDWDILSDAASTVASSRGSQRTYCSSKNRRKHERKVASIKEGSLFEDVGLVMHLHGLVTPAFELRLQVREMVIALSFCDKEPEALFLQTSLEKLLDDMKDSFKEIWTNDMLLEAAVCDRAIQKATDGQIQPIGFNSIEPHLKIAPIIKNINWKLEDLK